MLYLLESDTRNVKWNGIPLHEATSAIIKEQMNGDFILTVRYPITDSEIYQLFREDMLIKAPAPVIGPQLFRIKKPVENDDHLEITAYHITDDVMQRSINPLSVNKQSCWQALSQLVQVAKSPINDFSFTSDITDRKTINTKEVETLYSVLMDGAHSIVGTWEGEMVRDNFAISIKRNRGEDRGVIISTHKNLKSYQRTKNSQNVVTRIHAKSTFKAEGAKEDTTIAITVDSPLIGAYPYINERTYTNNNIQTVEELTKWASAKFTNEHIDKATDAIKIEAYELDGQTVHMGDTVNLKSYKHNVDVYKKAIAYEYDCLANNGQGAYLTITFDDKVKSGGNGGGVSAVANAILDKQETQFDIMLERAIANADRAFDAEFAKHEKDITDGIELAKAKAEEVKQELSDTINQRFDSFDNGPLKEAKRKAEEALRNAGASSLLAQEAKRIGLDSTAKLEEFKRQATSAQTALSGDLDALKRTVMNDIRPKQEQVTAEIAKQVEALNKTKNELAGVKAAQATYEETTTRRFAELTNLANGKASKSELTQTAEELASKIASVQASGRNLFLNSLFKQDISKTRIWTTSTYEVTIDSESKYLGHNALKIVGQDPMGRDGNNPKITYPALGQFGKVIAGSTTNQDITITFYAKANKNGIMLRSRLGNIWYKTGNVTLSTEIKRYVVHIPKSWTNESKLTTNEWLFTFNQEGTVWIWMPKFEISDVDTSYSEAPEDTDGQISAVESNFKQRADALDAGVRSLTEGLRTKADISSLNVTAENIRQSVKSLETSTQNKLDQKLSMTEFEVRAGSIHQEILNATKDKADKTLVMTEAGKLREEFSNLRVGGTNLLKGSKGPFLPDRKPANFDNAILYAGNTSIYMEQGQEYIISAKTDGTFTAHHDGNKESDNVVLWIMDKDVRNYQIVSDLKTGTTGTKITWNKPTGIYHLRVNTYHKEATKSVWDVKIEKGNVATDWSPAPEDTDGLITEAKAIFERTAQGLRTDLSAIQDYVNKDGQRQETLQRYAREESAKQVTAVRELVTRDYVGKATYQEDVKGINQRIEAVKTSANKEIASQIASYRQSVDGKFTDISSQITTYKQDVGGQISGLSNRLTSSEQGTTTQISNLSNRINSNKQGTDNQISNLKTQVATNKANADSQFANVTNQLARKVETTDFQRVKETSQLYERIIGTTEDGIADKVARMALTNQLFQVEVGKYSGNGVNRAVNTTSDWGPFTSRSGNDGVNLHTDLHKILSSGFKAGDNIHVRMEVSIDGVQRFNDKQIVAILQSYGDVTNWARAGRTFDYNIGTLQPGNNWRLIEFDTVMTEKMLKNNSWMLNLRVDGASSYKVHTKSVKVEKGNVASAWSPAPEDTEEAVRTVQRQLAGSWAVQNLTSAGALVSGLNLGANGHNRLDGKLTHITGETLIDRAVIKSAMVDKLKTANFEAGSVTTTILDAEAVTAEKLKVDFALVRKLTANDAFIEQLTSKRIFSTKVESVVSSSTFLEAYQGRIGGFTIGHFDQGRGRWISGINQFSVGMGNGEGGSYNGENTAFWANWGYSWNYPGPNAWYVTTSGNMYCRNGADFHGKVDFSDRSRVNFYSQPSFSKGAVIDGNLQVSGRITYSGGEWLYSPIYNKLRKDTSQGGTWLYLDRQGNSGSDWIQMNKEISDRRYKSNIQDSQVSGLNVIEKLKTYSYRKEYDGKVEDISCGIMAQDVQKYAPEAFFENPDGAYSYRTFELVPYLIKAIQELNQKIEKMEKTIA
ncbi:TPA: tail fiber domain-containing protein [Streptococcus pneumoniae]|nr:tail fiber domain-containing protein [Streptococcus pneumoniae]